MIKKIINVRSVLVLIFTLSASFSFAQSGSDFSILPDPPENIENIDQLGSNQPVNPFLGIWCESMTGSMDVATRYIFNEDLEIILFGIFDGIVDVSKGSYELKLNPRDRDSSHLVYQIQASQTGKEKVRIYQNPSSSIAKLTEDGKIRLFSGNLIKPDLFESNEFSDYREVLSKGYNPEFDRYLSPCEKITDFETML